MFLNAIIGLLTVFTIQDFDKAVYKAYISGDVEMWERTLEKGADTFKPENTDAIYKLVMGYYGLIGNYLGKKNEDKAEELLDFIQPMADDLLERKPESARFNALKGALYGFEITLSSYKAMYYGPKSQSHIEKAMKLDPLSPQVWVEKANMLFHMPAMFGGSKQKGVLAYQKAIELFEKRNDLETSWLYLNALVMLGQYYDEMDKPEKSINCYKKALAQEPNFNWAKDIMKNQRIAVE